jgi:mRNA interferase MazF
VNRGEIWWAELAPPGGRRPVLLLSRSEAYERLSSVVVAPLTTSLRRSQSIVIVTPEDDGVARESAVSIDNIQAVSVGSLKYMITTLSRERMAEVEAAIHFALAPES